MHTPQSHEPTGPIFGIDRSVPADASARLIVEIKLVVAKAVAHHLAVFAVLLEHLLEHEALFEFAPTERVSTGAVGHHVTMAARLVPQPGVVVAENRKATHQI